MRTVGEILRKARLEKRLTFEEIEKQIKIRKKFLIALEENAWEKLPSLPYIKGFLKNYSAFLGLNPQEMNAIFRRQCGEKENLDLLPTGVAKPLNEPVIRFTPQRIVTLIIIFFISIFFGYLFIQYQTFAGQPYLEITSPKEGEIIKSEKVEIRGKTDPDAVLSINNQKIALEEDGSFYLILTFTPDVHSIIFEATSKYGKKKTLTRTIKIQPE